MGINDTLRGFIERYKERKQKIKEFEQNDKMVNTFEQKKLSHNERVLNKLLEQNRQKDIKQRLDYELEQRNNENKQSARNMLGSNHKLWSDNTFSKTPNIFKNNKSILSSR